MGLRRCGMDYQKEPASSMVYLWTLLYVFYLLLLDIEQLFCFRLRLCKHPGYRMILGLQAYKLQNQMMTCSRSSCSSQWFLNTPSSRNQSHPWNPRTIQNPTKMLPHCPVVKTGSNGIVIVLSPGALLIYCRRSDLEHEVMSWKG